MQIGDIVAVIDPSSARHGMWGFLSHTTRSGRVVVNFIDGSLEAMGPFQIEDYAGLASAAVIARQALPARRISSGPVATRSGFSRAGRCRCGHPEHKHREYRGYVACTCLDAPRHQCRCRGFNPPSITLQAALRDLFQRADECEREWDPDEAASRDRARRLPGAA